MSKNSGSQNSVGEISAKQPRLKIMIAKPGLDGHDRGAKVIARALRDAGMEVVYTGLHQSPEAIVSGAVQEDVDALGLSILSGAHMTIFPDVLEKLKSAGAGDVVVFGGGIIPEEDIAELKKTGVKELFTPGASTTDIVSWIRGNVKSRRAAL
jgi:methylmalonyl-CoA mutase C-terminal domain/subunit